MKNVQIKIKSQSNQNISATVVVVVVVVVEGYGWMEATIRRVPDRAHNSSDQSDRIQILRFWPQ